MTTRWAQCIACKRTFRIPLEYKDEGQICSNCPKPAGWEPPKLQVQEVPNIKKKGASYWDEGENEDEH